MLVKLQKYKISTNPCEKEYCRIWSWWGTCQVIIDGIFTTLLIDIKKGSDLFLNLILWTSKKKSKIHYYVFMLVIIKWKSWVIKLLSMKLPSSS